MPSTIRQPAIAMALRYRLRASDLSIALRVGLVIGACRIAAEAIVYASLSIEYQSMFGIGTILWRLLSMVAISIVMLLVIKASEPLVPERAFAIWSVAALIIVLGLLADTPVSIVEAARAGVFGTSLLAAVLWLYRADRVRRAH